MSCNEDLPKLCIQWGNAHEQTVIFTQDGEEIDITDYTILWELRRDLIDTDDAIVYASGQVIPDVDQTANRGKGEFTITSEQSKQKYDIYHTDFKIWDNEDKPLGNTTMFNIEIVPVSTRGNLPE